MPLRFMHLFKHLNVVWIPSCSGNSLKIPTTWKKILLETPPNFLSSFQHLCYLERFLTIYACHSFSFFYQVPHSASLVPRITYLVYRINLHKYPGKSPVQSCPSYSVVTATVQCTRCHLIKLYNDFLAHFLIVIVMNVLPISPSQPFSHEMPPSGILGRTLPFFIP